MTEVLDIGLGDLRPAIQKGPAVGGVEHSVVEPIAELSLSGDLLGDDDFSRLLGVPEHPAYGEGDTARLGRGQKTQMNGSARHPGDLAQDRAAGKDGCPAFFTRVGRYPSLSCGRPGSSV